ncbi:3'-5' exonuclease [Metabacillus halosaccharovorans]|uniref:3'-5' exonuclease n=1 Tax=Metabacillus halosaccharovorans TaxID=930124 RepID=UPI000994A21A|nr:3'-5' exonuclease [Metabacillus halosaccharovorans]
MPDDIKIIKYFLWDHYFLKYHIKKMTQLPSFSTARHSIEEFLSSQQGLMKQSLSSCTFTIFDLETTGFFPTMGDEIISIGAIKVKDLQIQYNEAFYTIVKPIGRIPKGIQELTGLPEEILSKAEPFPVGLSKFLDFSKGSILVAHPATFDIEFLKSTIKLWSLPHFSVEYLDSHLLANEKFQGMRNYLDELVERLGIPERERHHALNDAIMTAEVFIKLIEKFDPSKIISELQ